MIILLLFAFLSGLVTILAPCIWPLLPIILSSSIAGRGGHARPLGITLGIMLSFTFFTLSVSYLVTFFDLDPNILRIFAVVVISLLGLTMILPPLTKLFEVAVSRLTSVVGQNTAKSGSGFGAGFVTGLSLGLVWSPCAGPILASIATLAATGQVSGQVILITLAYVTGVGIPLFIFAYAGQKFLTNSRKLSPYTGRIQQVFGVVMILTAIFIYTNKAQDFQLALIERFPVLNSVFNGFESGEVVTKQLDALKGGVGDIFTTEKVGLFNAEGRAPEFVGITKWLNNSDGSEGGQSLSMSQLKGKVVLIDFWTYTCINCVRTLPYVTRWYDKYKDDGFVVIGVHTPEFAFEKDTKNVLAAIKKYNIHYPVAQDNDYATWNAYANQYWPAHYLIDAEGNVRRTHFGEGKYEEMEKAIRALLAENGKTLSKEMNDTSEVSNLNERSPETYLGSRRMIYHTPNGKVDEGIQTFTPPATIPNNKFAFGGTWNISGEYAAAVENAKITYTFTGEHVYLVLKPGSAKNGKIKVLLDGNVIDTKDSGKDTIGGFITVTHDDLYEIVDLKGKTEQHKLELQFQDAGLEAYAFTFG